MGTILFDNKTPSNGHYATTTGRGIDGGQNGTMCANDIFQMYAYLVMRGFLPNVMLIHPLAWKTFMTDTEMREVVLQGNTLISNRLPNGTYSPGWGTSHRGMGLRTTATGRGVDSTHGTGPDSVLGKIGANPWVQTLNPMGASFNIAPSYLPSPLTVLVTPFVPYIASDVVTPQYPSADTGNLTRPTCSVIMADSDNTGLLITKQGIGTEEFDDPARDIRALKINERYGYGLLEQGKSVASAHYIVIDRNYNFDNVNQVSLNPLTSASGMVS
jgi:hypothetical protein